METVFIYALKDPRDGAVRYIGKANSPEKRLRRHLNLKREGGTHKARWIRQLVGRGLRPSLEILDEVPGSKWGFFERAYIKIYREIGAELTNITDGGGGHAGLAGEKNPMFGKRQSSEARAKMSAAKRGKGPLSLEHRLRISATKSRTNAGKGNPFFGRKHTEEAKQKIREWNKRNT